MIRKTAVSGPAYLASVLGVLTLGLFAWIVMASYPATGVVLMIATLVALLGLGHGWQRHLRKQRLRDQSGPMKSEALTAVKDRAAK